MYSNKQIEEIMSKINIVDVIKKYIDLEKKDKNYFGLCPFHDDKTKSFLVSEEKQMFYCFGCGEGGDAIAFLMKYKNISFDKSLKILADLADIELEENINEDTSISDKKKTILKINKEAAMYYYCMLHEKEGKKGKEYFDKRVLSKNTIKKFGLGFTDGTLVSHLRDKGYSDDQIIEAGLASLNEKYGARDKFWNRVMFPIFDNNENVIGFGGRVMDDSKPKYLNSPETPVFDKSKNLFGLNLARFTKSSFFIICEGYMDVIAMHQAGFDMAVASLGTAFTYQQAQVLKRYTDTVILSYDSDGPGVNATLRGIENLKQAGLKGKVLDLKPYKDPDEFIKNLGKEAFKERLENAKDTLTFELEILKQNKEKELEENTYFENLSKKLLNMDDDFTI